MFRLYLTPQSAQGSATIKTALRALQAVHRLRQAPCSGPSGRSDQVFPPQASSQCSFSHARES